jgi:thymidylate kinase
MQNLPSIKNQLSSKDLFDAFKSQLVKDFEQSNFPTEFVEGLEPNYTRIHEKIMHELQRNENRSDSNVMQLLYRIDISESQLKKSLNDLKGEDHFNVIAELIIKRVLQKVVVKQYYKNNINL